MNLFARGVNVIEKLNCDPDKSFRIDIKSGKSRVFFQQTAGPNDMTQKCTQDMLRSTQQMLKCTQDMLQIMLQRSDPRYFGKLCPLPQ